MKILLATLHAKYVHNSLALPCLAVACKGMDGVETVIREFTVNEQADRVLRALVAEEADVAAFSCYIWNIGETLKLASDLKQVRPGTFIILGGPEASFGVFELMTQYPAIDCVIRGEGEETFRELMALLLRTDGGRDALQGVSAGIIFRAGEEIIATPERAPIADLDDIPSPFSAGLVELNKPLVYYESSRGCPFSCAFCMSSLERGVRSFSMERIRKDLGLLLAQGAQTVKFVDRTFNYDAGRANAIWEFILAENRASRFHFEIAADLLTEENFRVLRRVPPGMFRFEIGVQSGDERTLARVGRRSELERLFANVRRLREETAVIVHLDLVAGLPGEDYPGIPRHAAAVIRRSRQRRSMAGRGVPHPGGAPEGAERFTHAKNRRGGELRLLQCTAVQGAPHPHPFFLRDLPHRNREPADRPCLQQREIPHRPYPRSGDPIRFPGFSQQPRNTVGRRRATHHSLPDGAVRGDMAIRGRISPVPGSGKNSAMPSVTISA